MKNHISKSSIKHILVKTILLFVLGIFFNSNAQNKNTIKPNILFILTDDAGYHDYGFQGSEDFKTPQIDRLAATGIFCTNGYVSASVCGPSRAGLLTGRYQQRFGFFMNPKQYQNLPKSETTIADAMQKEGYSTGIIGKWHMGYQENFHPNDRGFDYFYGFLSGSRSYYPQKQVKDSAAIYRNNLRHNRTLLNESEMDFYTTDLFTDKAIEFMNTSEKDNKPFFLYLSYNAIHHPLETEPEDMEPYQHLEDPVRRITGGMTNSLDRNFGKLLNYLEEKGLRKNTLVVWVNDNGGQRTQMHTNNWPLRGFKGSELEGGNRVPFLLSMPGTLAENAKYNAPVISLDLFPTFLNLAGGNPANNPKPLDGVDLIPYLKGENTNEPHEILFWQRNNAAVRKGDWKLLKYVKKQKIELYNLKNDIGEKVNLADKEPEIVKELEAYLTDWQSKNAERMK
ncbi:sulfatase-like hydrolase/transferase [Lutibacter sp. A80]|uniref:sulfatase-like hydrolase/transferase n=1 Tax=Lutibacter sp. A80 TaxID=2918453 RepID=UPI001F062F4C|nr:sulfatase-like hydrolase/transferase [Lutibacter sp. A80]UMB59559.1 sulfatase-like hydrolase/transferase [Lutibacter sp. A80]